MENLLKFIDISKYIYLQEFFKNNNLPNDIFVYIIDTSVPFEKHSIDEICEKINMSSDQAIFFCNNIFDKMTSFKYSVIVDDETPKYCIEVFDDRYKICYKDIYLYGELTVVDGHVFKYAVYHLCYIKM